MILFSIFYTRWASVNRQEVVRMKRRNSYQRYVIERNHINNQMYIVSVKRLNVRYMSRKINCTIVLACLIVIGYFWITTSTKYTVIGQEGITFRDGIVYGLRSYQNPSVQRGPDTTNINKIDHYSTKLAQFEK